MTTNVDSIMALADAFAEAQLVDPYVDARAALRAAVEQLVQERDGARNGAAQAAMVNGLLKERAERAERQRDEAMALLKEARGWVNGDYDDGIELLARIDAMLKERKPV